MLMYYEYKIFMKDVFPQGAAYIDGQFVDISEARIPILDWGFLRSDATYDVVHVWKKRFFLLDSHIDRFFSSANKLRMPCNIQRQRLKKILAGCVKKSGLENAYVEMIQTRGMSPTFDRDPRKSVPRFLAFAVPFSWILRPENYMEGLSVFVTSVVRIPPNSIDSTIKNYHWLDLISGMFEAYDFGAQTGVLIDGNKNVLEGPGFNIFCLSDGTLYTPKNGILLGVTREAIINISNELKIPNKISDVSSDMFVSCSEVFGTSTAGGVMPITKINGKKVGSGKPGAITKTIHNAYWEKHMQSKWSVSVDDLLK